MKTVHDMVDAAKAEIHEVSVGEAEAAISGADYLIDVREDDEFHDGHIAGAINIPRGLLEFKMSNDEGLCQRDKQILLYCKTSGRAALSAKALKELGYSQVSSIAGGFDAWVAAGKAVVTPKLPNFD
ncbi:MULTISPECIES: rhodanese-like domain-containing protein [Spongiibacter]|uniref:rhodanese-like domain-containing protein n=1 Tax=Spongiibacter TaxID=630749 RepID=UPI001B2AE5F1|nr:MULTISPECIES: rhodanese-like domain-containing protein [Spongiibacter]MBO6751800.1 sulfurtransferase [Spongiibacter sp.]|tara:strand:- start:32967 stop:33347 length:381 start_codon:yes stop_codon:yes gene_type:complete